MQLLRIIIKSIHYYKWQNLALLAGMMLSTAVITGALITGDSVKLSLKKLVEYRLGNTGYALDSDERFFGWHLAKGLSEKTGLKTAAIIRKNGSASNPANGNRAGQVVILGVEADFFELNNSGLTPPQAGEVVISGNLAAQLGLNLGDDLIIRMESSGIIPPDLPFAPENYLPLTIRQKVIAIATHEFPERFSLQSNQVATFNAFVNRKALAERIETPDRANLLLIENSGKYDVSQLNDHLSQIWRLRDAGIGIAKIPGEEIFEMTSDRIFIEPQVSKFALAQSTTAAPVLTYLINSIEKESFATPYSFVTASTTPVLSQHLKANEIIINSWLADDLKALAGDTLTLKYFVQGERKKLTEQSARFVVAAIVPLQKSPAMESLMPAIPGLADAGSCSEWEAGVPVNLEAIREKDEKYWDDFSGTPKAFVAYETGNRLWGNEFGNATAIRFFANEKEMENIEHLLHHEIKPESIGIEIKDVRSEGLRAATNGVDFGELFLSLSFFVILAGLLLTAMLFQLQIIARSNQNAIFTSLGFSGNLILRLRLFEALPIIVFGAIGGAMAGIVYTKILMAGMNSVWQDIVQNTMLWLFVRPQTLAAGMLAGMIVSFMVIFFILKKNQKKQVYSQLQRNENTAPKIKTRISASILILAISFSTGVTMLLASLFYTNFQNTAITLGAGGFLLVGFITLIFNCLVVLEKKNHTKPFGIVWLAMKNTARNKNRSLSTISLLALGAFTIFVTGANRQTFYGAENQRNSGTGGFLYWIETAVPVMYDLNTEVGREKYALDQEVALSDATFFQLYNLSGDDASCLNLNQVSQPQILGVNAGLLHERSSFSFAKMMENDDARENWLALNRNHESDVIPAIADQTVITWGLMKKIGDTLNYLNEAGKEIKLVLIGGLNNSIFQGNLLIADSQFRKHFPSSGGSQVMLIDAPSKRQEEISSLLNTRLADLGINITTATLRLANFNAVTNTYLSVFMILGGLGMIIGTMGLAIVLLRNIHERRSEMALLAAIGFKRKQIQKLIFIENFLLLATGLIIGTLAAMAAIMPTFLSSAFTMSITTIVILISAILVSGTLWIFFAARYSLGRHLIAALKND